MANWFKSTGRSVLTAVTIVATTALLVLVGMPRPILAQDQGITLLRDAEIETFLRKCTTPIFNAAGIDPDAVTIYLVGNDQIQAFVSGGQNLFVFSGLIEATDRPNELIGVLAHETGHMAGGHLLRSSDARAGAMLPMILGMVMGVGAIAAGATDAGAAIIAGSQTVAQANILAFTRVQESSADQAGARFLEASGQSGKGLLTIFERLGEDEAASASEIDPYLQTHPVTAARISALEDKVEKSKFYDKEDPPEDSARLDLIKAKLHGFLDRGDVGMRRYPVSDKSAPARYARTVLYFRQGDLGSALGEINTLIAEQPKSPYFQELKGQILFESGRLDEAVPPYAAAVALAANQPLIRVGYGQALYEAGEAKSDSAMIEKAAVQLRASLAVDPNMPNAWRTLGQAYSSEGKEGLAELATAEMYFNAGGIGPAVEFATRARKKLDKGTVPYNRASDIIQVARASGGRRE